MEPRDVQLTALIVDDEPLARDGLRLLLADDPQVSTVLEARNGLEAVSVIRERQPTLVFLDVQMPEMDGFSVVQEVGPERMPAVVFVTAHDRYAIRAFEINAIDYLLKPVAAQRFHQALERVKARLNAGEETHRHMVSLLEAIASPSRYVKRLAIRSAGRTSFLGVEEIDWIQAAENYVQLHSGSASHMLQVTMNTLEASLDPEVFIRIHRSMIVNIERIKELQPESHGEYVIVLRSGVRLQSSRSYHDKVKALTSNPF
jgi:two-component system LytT family response regulator